MYDTNRGNQTFAGQDKQGKPANHHNGQVQQIGKLDSRIPEDAPASSYRGGWEDDGTRWQYAK